MPKIDLPLEKLICPICRGILIQPVTMPCLHALCLSCFDGSMEMANLTCPMCRKRVGGWLRTAKKQGKLVDKDLWEYIQKHFADYVTAKELGEDDAIEDVLEGTAPPPVQISAPGEIKKEFDISIVNLEKEIKVRQEAELKASEELIRKLQEEEQARLEEEEKLRADREHDDERLARELQEKLQREAAVENTQTELNESLNIQESSSSTITKVENKENKLGTSTPVRGPLDAFLKPLLSSRNTPKQERLKREHSETERCDSITPEILHFKPIKSVPLTPPKTLSDGQVVQVPVIRSTPVKSLFNLDSSSNSPFLAKQLETLQVEREFCSPRKIPRLDLDVEASAFRGLPIKKTPPTCTITSVREHIPENTSPDMFDESPTPTPPPPPPSSTSVSSNKNDQVYQDLLYAKQLQDMFNAEMAEENSYQLRHRNGNNNNNVVFFKRTSSTTNNNKSKSNKNKSCSQPSIKDVFKRTDKKCSQ